MLTRPIRLALGALALTAAGALSACGSDARDVDTCKTVESARCERVKCFPGSEQVTPYSCTRFYDVQCGRGVQDPVKTPTKAELDRCVAAIRTGTCEVVIDPVLSGSCGFLTSNVPPLLPQADAGAEAAPVADTGAAVDAEDGG